MVRVVCGAGSAFLVVLAVALAAVIVVATEELE